MGDNRNRRRALPVRAMLAIVSVALAVPAGLARAEVPAFPGAEGEGMYASGGRDGDVYHVTNLNDSGEGSFRHGLDSATGSRTIVFDVSGTIALSTELGVYHPDITIAGQTAPGMGICLTNYGFLIAANNVIARHVRVRPGDAKKGVAPGFNGDSLSIWGSHIIVDHCSASWSIDELLSCAASGFHDVTVQYCIISEALNQTGLWHGQLEPNFNPGGSDQHGMGSLVKPISGDGVVSYHHNLWSQNFKRNPAIGAYDATQSVKADIRNNVMYNNLNHGYSSDMSRRLDMNYVGNYIIAGSETSSTWLTKGFSASESNNCYIYQSGNKADGNRNGVRDGSDNGWSIIGGAYTKLTGPVGMKPVTTQTADDAYNSVISGVGAIPWARDSVDQRLINNVITEQGSIIDSQSEVGGYPVIPVEYHPPGWDTDRDGMPNAWETWYGTNPAAADNNGSLVDDGYTNLERYLAWVTDHDLVGHPGDTGGDNAVGLIDLGTLAINWGLAGKGWHGGDFNGDGTVNLTDLGLLANHYGWSGTPPSPAPVPEPASLSLLATVMLCAGLRRFAPKRR